MIELLWKSNLLLILLFAVYRLAIRDLSFFKANRAVLLFIPAISILYSLIPSSFAKGISATYILPEFITGANAIGSAIAVHSAEQLPLLLALYFIGLTVSVLLLMLRFFTLTAFIRKNASTEDGIYRVITTESDMPSFSFFRIIHVNRRTSDASVVIQHEKLHYEFLHSADNVYMEVLKCLFWFNPVIYLIHKEIRAIHEYEVDARLSNQTNYEENLIGSNIQLREVLLTNSYNSNSNLLKRIKMIRKKKSASRSQMRYLLFVPAIAAALTISACTENEELSENATLAEVTSSEVLSTKEELEGVTMPSFPGGIQAMYEYLGSEIKYPESAKEAGVSGKVFVSFVIREDGSLDEIKVVRGVNEELDREALRAVSAMPDWTPGEKEGKKVAVAMGLPILFSLE